MNGGGHDEVSLREYIERLLTEHEKAHTAEHRNATQTAEETQRRIDEQDDKNSDRFETHQKELSDIRDWQSKAVGALIVVSAMSAFLGAILYHVLFAHP